jgi:hypothetical protein
MQFAAACGRFHQLTQLLGSQGPKQAAGLDSIYWWLRQGVAPCDVLWALAYTDRHTCRSMFSHPSEMFSITVAGLAC